MTYASLLTVRYLYSRDLNVKYLLSNGTFQQGPVKDNIKGCKPGPGFVFTWNTELGICNNDASIHIERGSVSQWHTETSRTLGIDAKITLIDSRLFNGISTGRKIAYFKALSKGKFGSQTLITTSGTGGVSSSSTYGKLKLIQVQKGTRLACKVENCWFCSTVTNSCSKDIHQVGINNDEFFFSIGTGVEGIYIGGVISFGRYIAEGRTPDHFFPTVNTNINPTIIGIVTKDYLEAGFVSQQWEAINELSREKRLAGLVIATSALAYTVVNRKAATAGFKISDSNDRDQEEATNDIEENIKELSVIMLQSALSDYQNNKQLFTLNAINGYADVLLRTLTNYATNIQDFQMYLTSFLATRTTILDNSKETALAEIKDKYPTFRVLDSESTPEVLIVHMTNDTILTTNILNDTYKCLERTCYIKGRWTKWEAVKQGERIYKHVEHPIATTATCGLYFKPLGPVQEATIIAYDTFDKVLKYLLENNLKYFYVNKAHCAGKTIDPIGSTPWVLESRLQDLGYEGIKRISEEKFQIDCNKKVNATGDQYGLVSESILCKVQSDIGDLKKFSDELQPTVFERRSALVAYSKEIEGIKILSQIEGGFGRIAQGAVKVASVGGDIWNALENGSLIKNSQLGFIGFIISVVTTIIVCASFLAICCIGSRKKANKHYTQEMAMNNG